MENACDVPTATENKASCQMTDATSFTHWFTVRAGNGYSTVVFQPFGAVAEDVEGYRRGVADRTGQAEPLYNGYDWAMLFIHALEETGHGDLLKMPEPGVDARLNISGSTDDVFATITGDDPASTALAEQVKAELVAIVANTELVNKLVREGKAVD